MELHIIACMRAAHRLRLSPLTSCTAEIICAPHGREVLRHLLSVPDRVPSMCGRRRYAVYGSDNERRVHHGQRALPGLSQRLALPVATVDSSVCAKSGSATRRLDRGARLRSCCCASLEVAANASVLRSARCSSTETQRNNRHRSCSVDVHIANTVLCRNSRRGISGAVRLVWTARRRSSRRRDDRWRARVAARGVVSGLQVPPVRACSECAVWCAPQSGSSRCPARQLAMERHLG